MGFLVLCMCVWGWGLLHSSPVFMRAQHEQVVSVESAVLDVRIVLSWMGASPLRAHRLVMDGDKYTERALSCCGWGQVHHEGIASLWRGASPPRGHTE